MNDIHHAVILARYPYKEYDELIKVYSGSLGKQLIRTRSTKKIVSKNMPHLEPGSLVELQCVQAKSGLQLTRARAVDIFPDIHHSLVRALTARISLRLFDYLVPDDVKDIHLYIWLVEWFDVLREVESVEQAVLLLDVFALQFLMQQGMTPLLGQCARCDNDITEEEQITLSVSEGGQLCRVCVHDVDTDVYTFPQTLHTFLEQMREQVAWRAILGKHVNPQAAAQFHEFVHHFSVYHTQVTIADWKKQLHHTCSVK